DPRRMHRLEVLLRGPDPVDRDAGVHVVRRVDIAVDAEHGQIPRHSDVRCGFEPYLVPLPLVDVLVPADGLVIVLQEDDESDVRMRAKNGYHDERQNIERDGARGRHESDRDGLRDQKHEHEQAIERVYELAAADDAPARKEELSPPELDGVVETVT